MSTCGNIILVVACSTGCFCSVQAIPFLLELRELLDWACTRTVLGIMYWFKVQDIWSSVFVIKSFRHFEKVSQLGVNVS